MCFYLYIHNKYTQYTLIYYVNKPFILDVINRLTALIKIKCISVIKAELSASLLINISDYNQGWIFFCGNCDTFDFSGFFDE